MSVMYKSSNLSDKKGSKEVYFASFFLFQTKESETTKDIF